MPAPQERDTIKAQAERTMLAALRLPDSKFDPRDPFGELRELAAQAGAIVVGEMEQRRDKPQSGTYMGKGKVDELRAMCETVNATMIIFDHDLSPKQIANIEQITERKVLDRSELILDIFASRATTHEAKLQVELAQLEYTYPRLRAMWSHLERIVGTGGIGGVGTRGPGEQQLEIDRRLVQKKKTLLLRELAGIQERKRRAVEKRNVDHFTVGLVGYTNAGKSTLFNALTTGGAYADDRLFATLMTRTRSWDLGGGHEAMLSDTVGFVRDLPHHLVASFRATLEEATHADMLLILLDVSDPNAEMHYETVLETLDELFKQIEIASEAEADKCKRDGKAPPSPYQRPRYQVLLNKADKVTDESHILMWQTNAPGAIPVCSIPPSDDTPQLGIETIIQRVSAASIGELSTLDITIPLSDSKTIHIIENRTKILDRSYEADSVTLRTVIGDRQVAQLRAAGARMTIRTTEGETIEPAARSRGWQ